jgi:hypothetical protein
MYLSRFSSKETTAQKHGAQVSVTSTDHIYGISYHKRAIFLISLSENFEFDGRRILNIITNSPIPLLLMEFIWRSFFLQNIGRRYDT